jgi:acetyl-CoA acyltransferase
MPTYGNGRRVAVVAGIRTPFARSGTAFRSLTAIDLGRTCVAELMQRTNVPPREVDLLAFGTVIPSVQAPNIAR